MVFTLLGALYEIIFVPLSEIRPQRKFKTPAGTIISAR